MNWKKRRYYKIGFITLSAIIALCIIIIAIFIIAVVYEQTHWENKYPISKELGYYCNSKGGYIYNRATNEVIIPSVDHIVKPKGEDSIAVFHWGNKRGYFNVNNGEIISQPQYEAAWIFSSGVGAVAKNDSILFIGLDGKPIHNRKFKRIKGEDYLYKGEYCIIKVGDKYGAIDKTGEWVIKPEWNYAEANPNGLLTAWQNGWAVTVYDNDSIMPFPNRIEIVGDTIYSYSDSLRIYIRHLELEN